MVDDLIGKRLAKYEIQSALGEGGMARVYLAVDTMLKRTVALKVIAPDLSAQERYRERFEREAQAIAALDHPKIVPVYEFDHVDDLYYMVLKFIEGEDLGRLMNRYAAAGEYLPTEDIMLVVDGIAHALDYAHSKGVIHRDVKPSNIMIDRDGNPYLSDFGLALNLAQGTVGEVLGTPHYVSPEQARDSSSAVPQSDIYSLGVVLFELFTGVVPFDDPSPTAIALQHVMNEPPSPRALNNGLSPLVENVILTAMAKKVEERYQSGAALAQGLRAALQNVGKSRDRLEIPSLPPLPPGIEPPPQRRPSMRPIAGEVRASLLARAEATKVSTATVPPAAPPVTAPSLPPATKTIVRRSSFPWMLVLLVIILIAVGIGALAFTGNLDNVLALLNGGAAATEAATEESIVAVAAVTDEPTATDTLTDEPTDTPTATPSPTEEPTATITPTDTDEPTATATVTIQPSDTDEPPTATSSPTIPSTPMAQLRRSIAARGGPGSQYDSVAQLDADAELVIVGISEDGAWFQIELPDGSIGWITTSTFVVDAFGAVDALAIVAAPTDTASPTPSATSTPSATATNTAEPTATLIPATDTDTPTPGPTSAPKDWRAARFIYDNDMFTWVNESDEMVSSELLTFERVDGDERFAGNRMPRYFINPGRCMQIVFTDVARPNCPDNQRPISYYTPTRGMGIDFWTGDEGQFRVIWQFEEIAVCDIAAGECELSIPPPQ